MGFEHAENDKGQKLSCRWQASIEHCALMMLELLADAPDIAGSRYSHWQPKARSQHWM